jgi:PAS domain S-box-containing protein
MDARNPHSREATGSRFSSPAEGSPPSKLGTAVRATEESFQLLVERVKDYAIFMLAPDGRIVTWNEGAQRIKGYRADEIIGQHISRFYLPEDIEHDHVGHLLRTAETQGRVEDEGWRVRKDGSRFWANVVITALRDDEGNLRGFGKVTRDLTERRKAQESVRLLSERLLQLQDEEQRRIARELQGSVAVDLDTMLEKLSVVQSSGIVMDWPTAEALRQSQALGKEIAKQVRSLANLLYPRLLDEAGLAEAIRWYGKGFEQRSGFKVSMELPSRFQRMVQEVERTLFRVVQEALTNVHRHSGGESVEIRLEEDRHAVQLEIKDDGHGMPPRILEGGGQEPPPGVGILGMTERVRLLGGRVEIQSGTWGTRVTAVVPLSVARPEETSGLPASGT